MGEINWTVVTNNDGEFTLKEDRAPLSPGSRATPIKQPDNLDLPKECTEGQYVTTYNEHYTTKRISMDVSPTHDKFARSLRQSPPSTPRSLSRQSLDRSSPERKNKNSPRSSPDKERRTSVGSYTVDKSSNVRRKTSEVARQTGTSKDSSLKSKRKFSTTQTKAAAKARASTPGTSPSTSPSRKQKERSDSPSSASESDASQVTYSKRSTTSTHSRADVVRRNLMDSFDKESPTRDISGSKETITKDSSRPSSPEKSPVRKSSIVSDKKTTGILRKESRSDSKSTITTVTSVSDGKVPDGIAPHLRDKSPEYSSEGSVGKEVKHSQRKNSPDSSPERAAFTPIKQFRTSPEMSSETIQVTASETDQTTVNKLTKDFIEKEALDAQKILETVHIDVKVSKTEPTSKDTAKGRSFSPNKEPRERKTSPVGKEAKPRPSSPQKARSPSPGKQPNNEKSTTRKGSFTRKDSFPRGKSPTQNHKPRSPSPNKSQTARKPSVPQRSPSPQKEQPRAASPTKRLSGTRKPSLPARSPSPTKTDKSRSPSPTKKETVITSTTTTVTRRSSLKKDSAYNAPQSTRRPSRQGTPSPVKDVLKSRSPSPKKESPGRRPSSPGKTKSPSPQRTSKKRSHQQVSSPSISPCSSPERPSERKPDKSKPVRKSSGPKSPDSETLRTTRRSSIPRADQSTLVRKTVETKIEIRSKPASKIPASTNKTRPGQSPMFRNTRTDSQNSLDRQTTTRSYSTTIKKSVEKPKEPAKKTPVPKKTVTTTAVISLQKPTATSQVRQTSSTTVSRATTYKRTPSKEITPKKGDAPADKKPMVTTTTKRVASRTNTPKSKPVTTNEETDRSSVLSSPEPGLSDKVKSEAFIEQLRKDEVTIHGYRDETLNIEITDNDLENETRPELYPETDDDEDKPEEKSPEESTQHKTEKTINIDSKRKVASQFMVTIKNPAATTPTKASTKPVTTRSSSGPVRGSPQTPSKTNAQKTTPNKKPTTISVQKADSLNLIRTNSDKNVTKNTTQKRQLSKPEMSTSKPSQQTTKASTTRQVTETGIASRNVTTAKSATIKRVVPTKKQPAGSVSSSSSEDEGENIPSVVTPNPQEQQYIEELEEMRRNEELEYASKLTATTNQENQLLSVIVQHPKSSRESSPDFSNRSQPFCTVSDDGGSNPRYADLISEPEDVEVFDPKDKPTTHENYVQHRPRFEQVTDLDEESEAEEVKLNVSVADRVSHFLETSKIHNSTTVREEPEPQTPTDSSKNVLKAKAMFETIAKSQKAPPAPGNKPVDILSRPSVFEARRGQTAPKPVYSDTFPRMKSPENVQRRGSIQMEYQDQVDEFEVKQYDETFDVKEVTAERPKSPTPVKKAPEPTTKPEKKDTPTTDKASPVKKESVPLEKQPEKTPKTDPTSRTIRKEPTPSFEKKKPDSAHKTRPFEKTISATAEISSKRAFFERKAQAQTSPARETKPYSPVKERKPLTDSIQNKENIRGSSPPRKTSSTTFIENERKSSRVSPERKISAPAKERKRSLKSESPERKISLTKSVKERRSSFTKEDVTTSQSTTFQKKDSFSKVERKTSPSRESPERRAPITQKIFPDHKSKQDVPDRKVPSSPVKDRKPSFPSQSPERSQRKPSIPSQSPERVSPRKPSIPSQSPERVSPRKPSIPSQSPERVSQRKPSIPSQSPERVSQRKASTSSPERSVKSPERRSPSPPVELNKAGKFGVTLRRTSSTTSAGTPRRPSIPGETQEIEDVTDLSLLEIMMEKAVGYEQRRRIRAQIRIVKKVQDDKPKTTRQKSPTRSPSRDYKTNQEPSSKTPVESKKPERRPSSPTKSYQERVTVEQRSTKKVEVSRPQAEPVSSKGPRRQSPEARRPSDKPLTNGYASHSPERGSPTFRTTSPQRKESLPERSPVNGWRRSPEPRQEAAKNLKTESVEITSTSTVRSQKRTETLVEKGVDSITSSYGVGPTDENGRPLFGLRALRRSNTNKQLTDDVVEVKKEVVVEQQESVCDSRGRPLFGGLKALRAADILDRTEPEMPELSSSTQLRELVERHEKVARESNGPQDQPRQKPKAKLRDSFILQDEDSNSLSHLSEVNNLNRGLSLRSIIQKHEGISNNTGTVRSEVESSHTVVTSRSEVTSDGSVSLSRDVIQGELSAKNGQEPVGKVTRTQFTYQSPHGDDKGINKVTTTTTTLGGRRTSGPKITEIEDVQDAPQRKSSLKSSTKRSSVTEVTEEVSGRRSAERIISRKGSLQKTPSEDEDRKTDRRFSSQEEDEEVQKVTSRVSTNTQKFTSSDDSGKSRFTSTRQTESRTKSSSPSLRRQKSSEEESSTDEKRKTVVRGDSVRALQHKFQQATESAANSSASRSSQPPRAGLILRTSSFTSASDRTDRVSSTLKQSTNLSADKKQGRQSPDKRRESPVSDTTTPTRESPTKSSSEVSSRRESLRKSSSDATSTTTTRVTESSSTSSFLDNTSRVTGVQDILTRMRNADLVNECGDTDADREARALLNKFLGASVILQGMEQGMRGTGTTLEGTPGSAALVSSVEKQRVATTRQKEEDIENIWDEQVLKTLLEQCTDYDGRRKLRARLRTVMAEHKACADLVAVTGDSVANSALAESETKHVTMRTDGGSVTRTEVHTRTSTNRLTKASSVSSPFAKFRQLERQNSAPSVGQTTPLFKITDARVARSASTIKDRLLSWVQAQTREYKNIQIDNFSTSWNNGLAFCALIHHFCPDAFDYDKLTPEQRRYNFELAFRVAEEEAGIAPLLDVEDMVVMRRPDWKCVFTYVQSVYRRFHSTPEAVRC